MTTRLNDDLPLQRKTSVEHRSEMRKVASQNQRERLHCDSRTHALDRERKSLRAQLDREEKELRGQLDRLEIEKSALEEGDIDYQESEIADSDSGESSSTLQDAIVSNPYPVTIGKHTPRESKQNQSRTRKASYNEQSETRGKMLPPLHSSSGYSLVSCRSEVTMSSRSGASTSRSSMTALTSRSCGVMTPRGDNVENEEELEGAKGGLWVGDPEAIQSVRRPRRTIAQQQQQRHEAASHAWKRSRSLKEKTRPTPTRSTKSLGRSQSLRDAKCGIRSGSVLSPSGLSRASSRGSNLSRSPSQHSTELLQSIECLVDPATEAELNRGPAHRCLRRHLVERSSGSQHMGTSPDTKSAVWGWIRDVDPNSDPDVCSGASSGKFETEYVRHFPAYTDNESSRSDSRVQRKASLKKRRPRDLASISADSVGLMGNVPLIPSPSALSVEKCYELLAASPIGAPKSPAGPLPTKLAPLSGVATDS